MSASATAIATLSASPGRGFTGILSGRADWIEWRADLLGDLVPECLRGCGVKLLYSLRSALEGGQGPIEGGVRTARLRAAEKQFDFVELEGGRDLDKSVLATIPPYRRVISWHGQASNAGVLRRLLVSFCRVEACLYRFVTMSEEVAAALVPIQFLAATGRRDVIAYSESGNAAWTRPLAARYGAPVVFGNAGNGRGASPADLSTLMRDYGLPELHQVTELCAIVGTSVNGSPSPRLHNAAYRALGAPRLFVRLPVESFGGFWRGVMEIGLFEAIGLRMRGVAVASPHKNSALVMAAGGSAISRKTESANVMFRRGGDWHADSTDAHGVLMNLKSAGIATAGRRVAVIGCGGSGRPIAAALRLAGAKVTLVNRSMVRGRRASELLKLPFVPLAEFAAADYDMIINATPVGREGEELPVDLASMKRTSVVVDLVFSASTTPLSSAARRRGYAVIDGRAILLVQAARQYELMTGEKMPRTPVSDLFCQDIDNGRGGVLPCSRTLPMAGISEI